MPPGGAGSGGRGGHRQGHNEPGRFRRLLGADLKGPAGGRDVRGQLDHATLHGLVLHAPLHLRPAAPRPLVARGRLRADPGGGGPCGVHFKVPADVRFGRRELRGCGRLPVQRPLPSSPRQARGVLRLARTWGKGRRPGPASMLCHSHDNQTWNQRTFVLRGTLGTTGTDGRFARKSSFRAWVSGARSTRCARSSG